MQNDTSARSHQARVSRSGTTYPRKRTGTACQVCRARRTKCDNERPCLYCRKTGATCVIDSEPSMASFDPASVQILAKIEELQKQVASLNNNVQATPVSTVGSTPEEHTIHRYEGAIASSIDIREYLQRGNLAQVFRWSIWEGLRLGDVLERESNTSGDYSGTQGLMLGSSIDLDNVNVYLDRFFQHVHSKNPILDEQEIRQQVSNLLLRGTGWDAETCLILLIMANGALALPFPVSDTIVDKQSADTLFDAALKRLGSLCHTDLLTQSRCHFYCGVYFMTKLRPFDAWRQFLQGVATCQRFAGLAPDKDLRSTVYLATQDEETVYWSNWKSERELRVELDLSKFGAPDFDHLNMFPTLPQGCQHTSLRTWYFYLAEISLWRIETAARERLFSCAGPSFRISLDHLAREVRDLHAPLDSWQNSLPDPINLEPGEFRSEEDVLRFVLRGRLTYNNEVLTWPFVTALVHSGEVLSPQVISLASDGIRTHCGRLMTNRVGFRYRHHGTWLMLRSSARSACVLIAVAQTPFSHLLPAEWVVLINETVDMLEYWGREADQGSHIAAFIREALRRIM